MPEPFSVVCDQCHTGPCCVTLGFGGGLMINRPLNLQTLAHFHLRCCCCAVSCLGLLSAENRGRCLCEKKWPYPIQRASSKTTVKLLHSSGSSQSKTRHLVLAGRVGGPLQQKEEMGKHRRSEKSWTLLKS